MSATRSFRAIFRPGLRRASGWAALSAVLACRSGGIAADPSTPPPPVGPRILPADQLYVLEASGTPPGDTTLAFPVGTARTVILRHGAPDNTVFAQVVFPAAAFAQDVGTDSVHVSLRPRPGIYGLEFACDRPLAAKAGARLVFKYPVHFSAPVGAQQRYGSAVAFERALAVAQLDSDGRYDLLPSARPATDNLEARLSRPGTY
ncbi:MAG: hypothetical protein ACREMO_03190, partial [Gemmatimonadales bacterium]